MMYKTNRSHSYTSRLFLQTIIFFCLCTITSAQSGLLQPVNTGQLFRTTSYIQINDTKSVQSYQTHKQHSFQKEHRVYSTLSSDNTITFASNAALNANMQAQLIVPYTMNKNPAVLDKTFFLNYSKHTPTFSLGVFSLEVGKLERMYGRAELGLVLNNGKGLAWNMRAVVGYNVQVSNKNFIILRPEIGLTYLNRQTFIENIDLASNSRATIMGHNFSYRARSFPYSDHIAVTLRENVFSLSPSLGIWLLPYCSNVVMRLGIGYNYVFSQKYSIFFSSNRSHLREHTDNVDLRFSNTNGKTSNFFSYDGLFISLSIGYRF